MVSENEGSLYDNLLRATDNTRDMVFPRYATVTNIHGELLDAQELDSDMIHENIINPGSIPIKLGDKVLVAFAENDLYQPYIVSNTDTTDYTMMNTILSLGLGLFNIDSDGYLWVELPAGIENYYSIDGNGDLYADTEDLQNNYTIEDNGELVYDRWDF